MNIKKEITKESMETTLCSKFIVIEGIDGCGKGVVMSGILDFLNKKGVSVQDLREKISDLTDASAILTCEPTNEGEGFRLRNDILRNLSNYSARDVAESFAKDRAWLYETTIIPALLKGMFVFQDRSLVSSLVYQIVQAGQNNEELSQQDVLSLEGNRIALQHPPGLVIVQKINPEVAYARLNNRTEKTDDSDFEKIGFLRKISAMYDSPVWRNELGRRGTKIIDLDCDKLITPQMTREAVIEIIERYVD